MEINKYEVKKDLNKLNEIYKNDLEIGLKLTSISFIIGKLMLSTIIVLILLNYLNQSDFLLIYALSFIFYIVYSRDNLKKFNNFILFYDKENNFERIDIIKLWSTLFRASKDLNINIILGMLLLGLLPFTFVLVFIYLINYILTKSYLYLTSNSHNNSEMLIFLLIESKRFIEDDDYNDVINKEFIRIFKKSNNKE